MTALGDILSSRTAFIPVHANLTEVVTPVTTTSATLQNITGATDSVTLPAAGRIICEMNVQSSVSPVGSTGGWTVSINSVDGTEMQRVISGSGDIGSAMAAASANLGAGTYTIWGRHRRVSGSGTISTDKTQLIVRAYLT